MLAQRAEIAVQAQYGTAVRPGRHGHDPSLAVPGPGQITGPWACPRAIWPSIADPLYFYLPSFFFFFICFSQVINYRLVDGFVL